MKFKFDVNIFEEKLDKICVDSSCLGNMTAEAGKARQVLVVCHKLDPSKEDLIKCKKAGY